MPLEATQPHVRKLKGWWQREARSWQGPPPTESVPVASSLCPPFLIFSSIWRGCAHPPRWGLQLRENVPPGHLGEGRRPGATEPGPAASVAAEPSGASVSPTAVGRHYTTRRPGTGFGIGHKPVLRVKGQGPPNQARNGRQKNTRQAWCVAERHRRAGTMEGPGQAPHFSMLGASPAPEISAQLPPLRLQSVERRRGALSAEEKVKVSSPEVGRKIVAGSQTPAPRLAHSRQSQADTTLPQVKEVPGAQRPCLVGPTPRPGVDR